MLGTWTNVTGCRTSRNDTQMKPCGNGRIKQHRSCENGVLSKCRQEDKERFIKCSLSDCPGTNYIAARYFGKEHLNFEYLL